MPGTLYERGAVAATRRRRRNRIIVFDSFNRADSATSLGIADTGQAWRATQGIWGISAGQAYLTAPQINAVADVDAGTADVAVQITVAALAGTEQPGPYARVTNGSNWIRARRSGTSLLIEKRVGVTVTTIGTAAGLAFASGDIYRLVLSGTSITAFLNGTPVLSVTESDHATVTRHGFGFSGSDTGCRFDDFLVIAA